MIYVLLQKKVFCVLEIILYPGVTLVEDQVRAHSAKKMIRANTLADTPQEEFWTQINYTRAAIVINQPKENTVREERNPLERYSMVIDRLLVQTP